MRSLCFYALALLPAGCGLPADPPVSSPPLVPAPSSAAPGIPPPDEPALAKAVPVASGSASRPMTDWVGTWDFPRMALRLEIVDEHDALIVTAANTSPKAAGRPDMHCDPVELTSELACTIHGNDADKVMNIHLQPAGADITHLDFLTLSIGGYPVETGSRYGVDGEPQSEP